MIQLPSVELSVPPTQPQPKPNFDINALYLICPAFLKVIRKVPGVNQTGVLYTFKEICELFGSSILMQKDLFFDARKRIMV